ncbi:MAG: LuxR C-terminal-related transcriptional regulator [Treponema sp.]|nr:LuxR C-terminal-related transcriptional regulator [Treponema sp.]
MERPRVEELLDKAMATPIVLVLGGAGYGKTHAVYSYLNKRKIRTVWMQLSERDNFCDRFWENFTQSMSMLSSASAKKLAKQGFPATARQFEQYLSIPLEDVDPGARYVFVYDDLHLIHDRGVLRFLEHSITTPFFNITSILVSRKELPFNLMNFYSKGLLSTIEESELRFKKEEMESYFSMQNISAPQGILDSIYRDTEGWAFAIQIAGHYLQNLSPEGYGIHILRSNIYRLIESEVMAHMKSELRSFLIKLTLLDDASPELVRELARLHLRKHDAGKNTEAKNSDDEKKAESLLRQIEEIGSFIRFDEYRTVFSIHRLFRDYLGKSLDEITEDEKKEVYTAAADWCAANNLKMDAIGYYERAGDHGRLVAQINMLPLILPGRTERLLMDVMDRIPRDVYLKHAGAFLVYVRFLMNEGKLNEAKERVEAIVKTYEDQADSEPAGRVLADCYNNLGMINALLAPVTNDYSFAPYFEKAHYYKLKWGGEGETEEQKTTMTLRTYACLVGSPEPADMERYFAALDASASHLAVSMNGSMHGVDDLNRGEFEFFRMNLAEAEACLWEAVAKARERRQYEIEIRAYFYLMRIGLFRGDIDFEKKCHRLITAFLENQDFINRYTYYDICRGWFYAHLGECEKVTKWLKQDGEEAVLNNAIEGLELLVKSKAHLRENNYSAALLALKWARRSVGIFIMGRVEVNVLEAICRYQMGDKAAAYTTLEQARLAAEPNGFFMPFAEMGKDIRALSAQALKDNAGIPPAFLEKIRNLSSGYAKKCFQVAEYFSSKPSRFSSFGADGPGLSSREQDVLRALFQGFTQDEIAQSTLKSVNTVKSVIRRIYEKLGAANRADAIRIAMSRGFLEWSENGETIWKNPARPEQIRPLLKKPSED